MKFTHTTLVSESEFWGYWKNLKVFNILFKDDLYAKAEIFSSMSNTEDLQNNMLPWLLSHGSFLVFPKNSICHVLKWEFLHPQDLKQLRLLQAVSFSSNLRRQ